MKHSGFLSLTIYVLLLSSFPLAAQFGGGMGPGRTTSAGGIFAVAGPAKPGRIVTVGGRLVPESKISHGIPVAGFLDTILVKIGDRVTEGQPLLTVTRNAVGETFRPVVLESRLNGVVSEILVYRSQEVNTGSPAVIILDDSRYLLKASLSDRDAQAIRNLGAIPVNGVTPDGTAFTGKIRQLSQEPDYSTGLFTLTMEFPKRTGMFLGMVLFVDLPAQKAEGISVEKTAILRDGGKPYLWIISDENQLKQTAVVTGEEKDTMIIIDRGISPGDRYITRLSGNEKEGMGLRDLIQANAGTQPARERN